MTQLSYVHTVDKNVDEDDQFIGSATVKAVVDDEFEYNDSFDAIGADEFQAKYMLMMLEMQRFMNKHSESEELEEENVPREKGKIIASA